MYKGNRIRGYEKKYELKVSKEKLTKKDDEISKMHPLMKDSLSRLRT